MLQKVFLVELLFLETDAEVRYIYFLHEISLVSIAIYFLL